MRSELTAVESARPPITELEDRIAARTGIPARQVLFEELVRRERAPAEVATEWGLSADELHLLMTRYARSLRLARIRHTLGEWSSEFYKDELAESLLLIFSILIAFSVANSWTERQNLIKETGERKVILDSMHEEVSDLAVLAKGAKARLEDAEARGDPAVSCGQEFLSVRNQTRFKQSIWASEKVLVLRSYSLGRDLPAGLLGGQRPQNLADRINSAYASIDREHGETEIGKTCAEAMANVAGAFEGLKSDVADAAQVTNREYEALRRPGLWTITRFFARFLLLWLVLLMLPMMLYGVAALAVRLAG